MITDKNFFFVDFVFLASNLISSSDWYREVDSSNDRSQGAAYLAPSRNFKTPLPKQLYISLDILGKHLAMMSLIKTEFLAWQEQSANKKEMIDSLPKGLQKEQVRRMYAQEMGSKVPLFYYLQQHENLGNMKSEVGENQTTTFQHWQTTDLL
jgi:hypothetical protein